MSNEQAETNEEYDAYHQLLGISKRDRPPSDYRLLGLDPFEADRGVIDTAANKQMSYLHECVNGPHAASAEQLLNEVSAARLRLLNPESKAAYDEQLRARLDRAGKIPTPVEARPAPVQPGVTEQQRAPAPAVPVQGPDAASGPAPVAPVIRVAPQSRRKRSRGRVWILPILIACTTLVVLLWRLGLFDVASETR